VDTTHSSGPAADRVYISRHQELFGSWTAYLVIDIVVLNLLIEFVPSITIDSFYISILTACFLRLLLGVTLQVEHRVARYFRSKETKGLRLLGALVAYLVLFGSKFVILEIVDLVFRDHVDLGGFVEIVAIALTLLAAELAFRGVYDWLADH
jgi:hypothetical protein